MLSFFLVQVFQNRKRGQTLRNIKIRISFCHDPFRADNIQILNNDWLPPLQRNIYYYQIREIGLINGFRPYRIS